MKICRLYLISRSSLLLQMYSRLIPFGDFLKERLS